MMNLFTLFVCLFLAGSVKSTSTGIDILRKKSVKSASAFCFHEDVLISSVCESLDKNELSPEEREMILQNCEKIDSLEEQLTETKQQLDELRKEILRVCRAPFERVGNSCIMIGKDAKNYNDSVSFCESFSAQIVTPSTHEKFKLLKEFLQRSLAHKTWFSTIYWVSVDRAELEGVWKLLGGHKLKSWDDDYWNKDWYYPANECVIIRGAETGKLLSANCQKEHYPLCQYNMD